LSRLEDRLKAVEQDVTSLRAKVNRPQQHVRFYDELGDGSYGQRHGSHLPSRNLQSEEVEVDSDELQDSFSHENATDGMGAMVFSVEEDCGFFGNACQLGYDIAAS
jgi:hypothetical protein